MIRIAARSSPLSRAQVKEIEQLFHLQFDVLWVETVGDKDQTTSLRTLDKTDFFTREIDELVLSGTVRAGIHSAKDLPHPLPAGLSLAALTQGLDPRDALVLQEGMTLEKLPYQAVIATSSERREQAALCLRSDFRFIDLRGTIGQRLKQLELGIADGVIVAEAALIRLGLTHLNRIYLLGETVPGQGQLAVVCRSEDLELLGLFGANHCAFCT